MKNIKSFLHLRSESTECIWGCPGPRSNSNIFIKILLSMNLLTTIDLLV